MPIFDEGLKLDDCVILTRDEALAVFEWVPENAFAWDGSDSLDDSNISAAYKIFKVCDKNVPKNLDKK